MPIPRPIPMIGPMSGEISMAPIITAGEFTFNPSEAMKMAQMSTHKLLPRKLIPFKILSMVSVSLSDIRRLISTASSRDRHGLLSLLVLCVSLRLPNLMIRTTNWEGNRLTMLYFRLLQIIIGASPTRICMLFGHGYRIRLSVIITSRVHGGYVTVLSCV